MTAINLQPAPKKRTRMEYLAFVIDILMLVLIIFDLLWLTFDAFFEVRYLRELLQNIAPDFTFFYGNTVHPNFLFFDSFIVLIFVSELLLRWAYAVWRRKHSYWFFYPIVHWYDVLGCLPMGSFRILRLLRLGALMLRLHKWHVIDIRKFAIVRFGIKYYNIGVEEVADRVAVRILEETKSELQRGKHLIDEIIDLVVRPRKDQLIDFATEQLQDTIRTHYYDNRKEIRQYIDGIVRSAVERNREVASLEKIPVLGQYMKDTLRQAVCDIVFGVFDRMLQDFCDSERSEIPRTMMQALFEIALAEEDPDSNEPSLASEIVNQAIDIIIKRVDIKQWKIEMEETEAEKAAKKEK
jgi:hypothetical protein